MTRARSFTRAAAVALLAPCLGACSITTRMPGESHAGPRPERSESQRAQATRLAGHVAMLATTIGERNTTRPAGLAAAADYIAGELTDVGLPVRRHGYVVDGLEVENLEVVVAGCGPLADQRVVVGAHYDSARGTPGANDNASGVALLLELARAFAPRGAPDARGCRARTLHLVAFTNEEPPHFRTPAMGSRVYARALRAAGADVVAMLSLETLGYYSDAEGSQRYPFPFSLFYPSRGDFVAFVANGASRPLAQRVVASFRARAAIASEGVAAPALLPGIDWSDQQGFWLEGYPGLMVTDTAPNRDHAYHEPGDTADRLDYAAMALVAEGLAHTLGALLEMPTRPDAPLRRNWRM